MHTVEYAIEDIDNEIGSVTLGYELIVISRKLCNTCHEERITLKPFTTDIIEVLDEFGNHVYPEYKLIEVLPGKNQVLLQTTPLPVPEGVELTEDTRENQDMPLWSYLVEEAMKILNSDDELVITTCGCNEIFNTDQEPIPGERTRPRYYPPTPEEVGVRFKPDLSETE